MELLDLHLACNTPDAEILGNIKSSCGLPLSWIEKVAAHDRIAVLIGGGPSLADQSSIEEMRWLANHEAIFFALGNSAEWVHAQGFPVHFQVILDARPGNAEFVREDRAGTYLIASQCDPSVFHAVAGRDVLLWHAYINGLLEIAKAARDVPRFTPIIAHHTIGLTALNLVYVMGYRTLHLFGYDSSDREAQSHAFMQGLKTGFAPIEVSVAGRAFSGQPAMIGQAERFPSVAAQLAESGCEMYVHGDGLLPTMARMMNVSPPERWVVECDLGKVPARWDFFNWLLIAEMDRREHGIRSLAVHFKGGPNEGFRDDGLPETTAQRREMLDNVLRPLLSMIGASETEDPADISLERYQICGIVDRYESGGQLPELDPGDSASQRVASFLGFNERPIVITLREAPHWPQRNSNLAAWCEFARTCGHPVVFVRDTAKADEPITGFRTFPTASRDVRVRLALYRRALVNMGVANGPLSLACLARGIPYLMFKNMCAGWGSAGTPEFFEAFTGVPAGGQFPWAAPTERLIWEDDDLPAIQKAFAAFLAVTAAKAA